MNMRLKKYCTKQLLIDERQSSHKNGSRTTDSVFIIRTPFEKYCAQDHEKPCVGFIDFREAFDSI